MTFFADNTADKEIIQVTNTLKEQLEQVQSKLEVLDRSIDDKITKSNIETTKLEAIQNRTNEKITSIESRLHCE